jgi:hypothetical protein
MTPEELERRRPVWDAMSDVFLDTETRWGMPRIAFVLARSGYSAEELEAIWDHEIVPECAWNLLQIAGEWALFVVDEDRLTERAEGKRTLLDRMMGVASPLVIGGQWRAIKALRDALLALPGESEQEACARLWTAFVHVYIDAPPGEMPPAAPYVELLRATGASEAELVAAFDAVRPVFRSLLLPDERADEERRADAVRDLVARATSAKPAPR